MGRPLISIVVPIYKVEKYLQKCVESLLAQTYENCEIILVDDGSPDSCPALCDEFEQKYQSIKVLHKPNGGLGDARNYGVRHASADWIVFVDSDDYVTKTYIEDLWRLKEKHNADMAAAWSITADEEGTITGKKLHFDSFVASGADAVLEVHTGVHIGWSAYNNLYPKYILLKYPFPYGYYEDMACMYKIVSGVGNVAIGDCNENYIYVQHTGGSILNSPLSDSHMRVFEICAEFGAFIDENYPQLDLLKTLIYVQSALQMLNRQHMGKDDFRRIFMMHRQMFRKSLVRILKEKRIPEKTKFFAFLLCTEPWIYRICYKIGRIKKM